MGNDSPAHIKRQLAKFDELWKETCDSWPPPGFTTDKHTKKSWGLIAVPEDQAWKNVCDIIDVISKSWPWNVAYILPQLHITIAGLGNPTNWKDNEEILHAIMRQIVTNLDPIEIEFKGLNILRNTIIVQIIDKNDKFRTLVNKVSESISEAGLARNLKIGIHNELWWASIVRLYQPIPDDILAFASNFKNLLLGSTVLNSIHLIENNKTHDLEVKTIESYDFRKSLVE
jgi:hypothetical protein